MYHSSSKVVPKDKELKLDSDIRDFWQQQYGYAPQEESVFLYDTDGVKPEIIRSWIWTNYSTNTTVACLYSNGIEQYTFIPCGYYYNRDKDLYLLDENYAISKEEMKRLIKLQAFM